MALGLIFTLTNMLMPAKGSSWDPSLSEGYAKKLTAPVQPCCLHIRGKGMMAHVFKGCFLLSAPKRRSWFTHEVIVRPHIDSAADVATWMGLRLLHVAKLDFVPHTGPRDTAGDLPA